MGSDTTRMDVPIHSGEVTAPCTAIDARAGAFVDSLVIGVALGACFWVFDLGPYAGALVTLYLVVVIADFWLRYAVRLASVRG